MITTFNIGTEIQLEQLLDSRMLIQAGSGGGKSYLLRKILEETSGKVQQIVLDMEGEFATLREKYPFALAGREGDIPLSVKSAELLAQKVLETRLSIIIDLYELKQHERILFVKRFCEALINAPKSLWHPCLIAIDEAHVFCPENSKAESMSAVIDLCTRGRKRGFGIILATQRLSKLHKDAAAECLNKLIGRTGLDIDRKRAAEELGRTGKQEVLELRNLEVGEFYCFGPALAQEVTKFKVHPVKTTHPKSGSRVAVLPPTPSAIKHILKDLANLPQEAEQELTTRKDLQDRITELEGKLRQAQKVHGNQPIVSDKKELAELKKQYEAQIKLWRENDKAVRKVWDTIVQKLNNTLKTVIRIAQGNLMEADFELPPSPEHDEPFTLKITNANPHADIIRVPVQPNPVQIQLATAVKLPRCERTILSILATHSKRMNRSQLGILTGYSSTSGGFNNALSALRKEGFIEGQGDQISITVDGKSAIGGNYEQIPATKDELHRFWCDKLPKAERTILMALLSCYPDGLTREDLGYQVGYSHTSGGFNNALSKLRTLELITGGHGQKLKASKNLFV